MKETSNRIQYSEEFYEYLHKTRISWLKGVAILAFTLIPLFIVLDKFIVPDERFGNFVVYRVIVTAILIIQFVILLFKFSYKYSAVHGFIMSVLIGGMISKMTNELGGFDSSYYAGLNLIMTALVVLVPWGFSLGILIALPIIGSYVLINVLNPHPFQINNIVNNLYFVSSTAVIAIAVSHIRLQLLKNEYNANIQLKIAKLEQDTIMNSVEEGLFIIHEEENQFIIGNQHSEAVTKILGDIPLSEKVFSDVLTRFFPEKKINELKEYLKMLTIDYIEDEMIRDLNPLEKEETTLNDLDQGAGNNKKVLKFSFKKIQQAQEGKSFLISIKDATKEVEMENLILENELKAEHESQMMLAILHQGPGMLQDFLGGVELEISIIEKIINQEHEAVLHSKAIETIFRAAHSMKGNAALLDLKFFAERLNLFEEKISVFRNNPNISREDFLSFKVDMEIVRNIYLRLHELIKHIQEFQGNKTGGGKSALESIPEAIKRLIERVAIETNKKVKFNAVEIDFGSINISFAYILQDILVQLARNSLIHGIEFPQERLKSGKDECGTISLLMKPDGDTYTINFRDDGKSFDLEAIRKRGIANGKIPESEIDKWTDAMLVKLIFDPGFSTASDTTLHAGRGVGMDIIKQRIKNLGGDLKINYSQGKFTEFKIVFPVEVLQ
jgi:HPt (histidine-containing phosphotransfer) domain-containing protein